MGFFSGPSKDVVHDMARGVANVAIQIQLLHSLNGSAREEFAQNMKAEGMPTTREKLIAEVASVVAEQKMGWLKKNQFLGAIHGCLVIMGMPKSNAADLKRLIEIRIGLLPT